MAAALAALKTVSPDPLPANMQLLEAPGRRHVYTIHLCYSRSVTPL